MATEEAKYVVVETDGPIEIRDYESHILAETSVEGDLESAGNKAFGRLFRYISGTNTSNTKVEMTAPVSQQAAGEKIDMTAPVSQQGTGSQYVVSFMMPATYTMETIPTPLDESVRIREVPARRVAALRYSGRWTAKRYDDFKLELEKWIVAKELTITGEAVWARYNPPFTIWFLRRNEILIPIRKDTDTPAQK